ncbi:MAG: hypothetical protein WBY94_18080 [Polyangiaceae bacterium]
MSRGEIRLDLRLRRYERDHCASSNSGHCKEEVDGSPFAAKLAQVARIVVASRSWSALNGVWYGASGRSKMYASSDVWVAPGNGASLEAPDRR